MEIAEAFFVYAAAFCSVSALVAEILGRRDGPLCAFLACSMLVGYFFLDGDNLGVMIAAFFVGYFCDVRRGEFGSGQTKE